MRSIDRLTLRERLLLFAAALVVLVGLWHALLNAPLEARRQLAAERIATLKAQLDRGNDSMTAAAEDASADMPVYLERLRTLQRQVDDGEDALRELEGALVDAVQMRAALEELLTSYPGLRLVSASNLKAMPLLDDPEATGATGESAMSRVYRHGLVLTLEGGYLDCLRYLQAVEQLPWRLYWARLDLQADEYPRNRIVIEIHTLSLAPEWISV